MIEPLEGVGLDVKAAWELAHDGDLAAKHTYCKAINHSKVFFIFFSINNLFYTFFGYMNPNHSKVFFMFFSLNTTDALTSAHMPIDYIYSASYTHILIFRFEKNFLCLYL